MEPSEDRPGCGNTGARCGVRVRLRVRRGALGKVGRGYTIVRLSEVVRSIFYAPQYVALAQGFFEDEGLKIDLSTAWGADKGAAALISGACDIGFFGPEAAIYIFNQGAPDYLIGFAQLTQMDGSFFLARTGMPEPFSWEHVRGKTIVGARLGGVPEMVLEWVLKKHGIEPFKDVKIITSLAFAAAPGAFAAGIGDYIAQFEPAMTELEMAGQGKIVASMGVEGGEIMYTVYHVRRSQLVRDRDMLIRFTRALATGMKWVEDHTPAETGGDPALFPDTKLEHRQTARIQPELAQDRNAGGCNAEYGVGINPGHIHKR